MRPRRWAIGVIIAAAIGIGAAAPRPLGFLIAGIFVAMCVGALWLGILNMLLADRWPWDRRD